MFQQSSLFPVPLFTVSDLTRYLRQVIETDLVLQDIWIQGEVSNLSMPGSGHIYFTLKDSAAALRCVIWRGNAARYKHSLKNGMALEAHGALGLYERDGQYQLYIDALRPAGEGWLYQEFLRLKARLEAQGLFAEERKRSIPARPRCIGIVTSATGAALQDILNTLRFRDPRLHVIIAPAAVQGEEAPLQICAALAALNYTYQPEVIILARGGGSIEDLWAFNDERVVHSIAESAIPVVTGIGHETDFTLADFVADRRAPTPTAAAVLTTPEFNEICAELETIRSRLQTAMQNCLENRQAILQSLAMHLAASSPLRKIRNDQQRIDLWRERARLLMTHRMQLQRARLSGIYYRLTSLNPTAILERGFAIVRLPDGSLVRSVRQVSIGQELNITLSDGDIQAKTESV